MSPITSTLLAYLSAVAVPPIVAQGTTVCYGNWWFCLQRENRLAVSDVAVQDLSNRSMVWSWRTPRGRWNVSYYHSFPSGSYYGSANYTSNNGKRTSAIVYDSTGKWSLNGPPINARPWNLSYNGETFGYIPKAQNRFVYMLYTRNLTYSYTGVEKRSICQPSTTDKVETTYWWIERKSRNKCPISVNKEVRESPLEWTWETDLGKWRVEYHWDDYRGIITSMTYYRGSQTNGTETRLMIWQYNEGGLSASYISTPATLTGEDAWKLSMKEGETFGFTPAGGGQWNFNLYSRNIVFKPFVSKDGVVNL